ncbi:MAG: signal peptidase I, partial [Bacteroidetes bacterium]|nr:signal peptidase I [Bacteroidota bacterium]
DILVYQDKIIIYLENATISNYRDSGSMKPTFDDGANGIRIRPGGVGDLAVGDIITFRNGLALVVHRIVDIGIDGDGVYYITKGDNNRLVDVERVRFDDIEYVTVGVLW